jgi:RNA polymerase sigma-70 factor (ECF subfamily)
MAFGVFGFRRSKASKARVGEFEEAALEHLDVLYGAAMRLTRNANEAEDLVQDALVRAYRFQHHFEAGTNLKAWLRVLETEEGAPIGDGVMSRAAMRGLKDATSVAQEGLLRDEILSALDNLPEDYRLMIVLADIEELSYKEIAETVSVPIGTVMSRLHRARKMMQKQLIEQAVLMGIVAPEDEQEAAVPAAIDLTSYRQRKQGTAG